MTLLTDPFTLHRYKAYEDFEAVARDLVSRGVTSPNHLGCIGGSNGGLLVGNMLTRDGAKMFKAVVCQVRLGHDGGQLVESPRCDLRIEAWFLSLSAARAP